MAAATASARAGPYECQVLHVADTDQRMVVYCAEPGSPTQDAFRRLAARSGVAIAR